MSATSGQPATAEDARWTLQFVLDGLASDDGFIGLGYIDPYVSNAGVTAVEAPDATTLVVTTDRPNDQILRTYVPILPKHIWEPIGLDGVADFTNDPTVVGSGPYQAVEWQTGQFIRFEKNENYWKDAGAADEFRAAYAAWKRQNPFPAGSVHTVIDHIEHIVKVAGVDHVGLGSDYDGIGTVPRQLEDVSCYPYITQELLNRGHGRAAIHKILGGNVLRALRRAEEVARGWKD